jgi:hypothetical protein
MRRLLSISVLVVLLFAWTGALFATPACCPQPTSQKSTKAESMAGMSCHHAAATPAAPDKTLTSAPAKCRMACCGGFSVSKNFSLTRSTQVALSLQAQTLLQAQPYLLALSGFSAVTDRGPPAA